MIDASAAPSLRLSRDLPAPPELVWEMWTTPEHFAGWYGPRGARVTVAAMDVRVGGPRLIGMEVEGPAGSWEIWFTGEHRVVAPPTRLSYTEAPADRHGAPLSRELAGLPDGHPLTTEVLVDLEPVDGGTRMTVTQVGIDPASPAAGGWEMAFDKLAERLRRGGGAG